MADVPLYDDDLPDDLKQYELDSDMADVPLYDDDSTVDYDGVYQESLPDNENISIEDFEQDLSSEEVIDYHQQADNAQIDKAIEDYSTNDFLTDSAIEEVEVPQTESPLKTSESLPNDYRTYRKQAKLEDELFQYQFSEDLGQLETGQSAFKRGLAKTTTKNRQYRMNKKRMSAIEQRLAELRGE